MNAVLEIGCGDSAGPFFEGADMHFIVDPDEASLAEAASQNPAFMPIVADASNLGFLADASINTILARNVFGDRGLRTDSVERLRLFEKVLAPMLQTGDHEGAERFMAQGEAEAAELKIAILKESDRLLVPSGKLIIVEQYSPRVAERFFEALGPEPAIIGSLAIAKTELARVAPASYASLHVNSQTWVAHKQ